MELAGKVALVTGASRGIGRAIAERLAAHGARVGVHYRSNRAAAQQTLAALAGDGHALLPADLEDPEAAGALVPQVVQACGRLDVLVNNAGIYEMHPPLDVDADAWRQVWQRTLATNLLAPAQLIYHAAQHMTRQGGGRIINISSRGAFRGEPRAPAYAASKAGLNALSQSMAQALAPHQVYVYAVAPGWVDTDMAAGHMVGAQGEALRRESPLGRVAAPEEIAHTVQFLAAGPTEYLTGGIIDANGASYLRG
jgi:3-oxoacyl-[acyl-carrier protein] reductase